MLAGKGMELDAVVELGVDDGILLQRIEGRAAETAGGPRADDNAEALAKRLKVYHEQTAPLIAYYKARGKLKTVDGMTEMDEVTRQIEAALRAPEKERSLLSRLTGEVVNSIIPAFAAVLSEKNPVEDRKMAEFRGFRAVLAGILLRCRVRRFPKFRRDTWLVSLASISRPTSGWSSA